MNAAFNASSLFVLAVFIACLAFMPLFSHSASAGINDVQNALEAGTVTTSNEGTQTAVSESEAVEAAVKKAENYELAIITDLHVNAKDYDAKEKVIKILNGWSNIDAVAILGDISQQIASPSEFARSKKFLDGLHHKKYCVTGNHDYIYEDKLKENGKKDRGEPKEKKEKLERFMKAYGLKSPHYAVKAGGYLLVFLCADELDGKHIVTLSDNALDWLDKTLDKNRSVPTIIFCHAPLEGSLEKVGELGTGSFVHPAGRVEKILEAHEQVFMWASGHTHTKPGSENFMSSSNFWKKQIHVVHNPNLTEKGGWINTLTLMPDHVIVKTYDCQKKEWLKKYERTFKHKFAKVTADDNKDKENEKDQDKKDAEEKDKEDMSGIVVPGLDNAKVRSSAWGPVIGTLFSGKFVDIKGTEGDWYIIDHEGKKGYVLKQALLTNIGDKSKLKKTEGEGTVNVNPSFGLNVRDGAWGDKIGKLKDGDKIDIIGQEGDWYKIKFNGKTGFVYKNYIKASFDKGSKAPAGEDAKKGDEKPSEAAKPEETSAKASDDDKTAKDGITGSKGFEAGGLLNVPERAQRARENGSIGSSLCGPTSLAMALDFYGINKSTINVSKETKTLSSSGAWQGTCCENILAAAKKNLPGSYMKSNMSIDTLKDITASGKPVVVNVDTQGYWSKGHYMVVTGVKDGKVYVNDPWAGGQRTYSFASFKAQWATRSNRGVIVQP